MTKSQITILGSGTCTPSLTRNPCTLSMKTGGETLLFDCGPGVMRRLLETGVSIFDVSTIFLSHFHPDHSGELASFLFSLKYSSPTRQPRPLTIVAGQGFGSFLERLETVYEPNISLAADLLRVIELDTTRMDKHAFSTFTRDLNARRPPSGEPGLSHYRPTNGKRFVYSGDTDVCDGLKIIAAQADLMVCEAAMSRRPKS